MACKYTYNGQTYTKDEFYSLVATTMVQPKTVPKYEKVLFPKGETAGLIQGFKDAMIKYKELENKKNKGEILTSSEIEAMQQFEKAQKSVLEFYEIKVGNILEKQFGKDNVKTITDEYGNTWNEVVIPEDEKSKVCVF